MVVLSIVIVDGSVAAAGGFMMGLFMFLWQRKHDHMCSQYPQMEQHQGIEDEILGIFGPCPTG